MVFECFLFFEIFVSGSIFEVRHLGRKRGGLDRGGKEEFPCERLRGVFEDDELESCRQSHTVGVWRRLGGELDLKAGVKEWRKKEKPQETKKLERSPLRTVHTHFFFSAGLQLVQLVTPT